MNNNQKENMDNEELERLEKEMYQRADKPLAKWTAEDIAQCGEYWAKLDERLSKVEHVIASARTCD